MYIQTGLFIEI